MPSLLPIGKIVFRTIAATAGPAASSLGGRPAARRAATPRQRFEARGEVPELRRLLDDAIAAELRRASGDGGNGLDDVVDVALRVRPARDGQAHQIQGGGRLAPVGVAAEHDRADLDA